MSTPETETQRIRDAVGESFDRFAFAQHAPHFDALDVGAQAMPDADRERVLAEAAELGRGIGLSITVERMNEIGPMAAALEAIANVPKVPARIEAQRERVEAMVNEHRERAAASRADASDVFGEDEPAWMAIDDAEVNDDAARSDRAWADACECRRCHAEGRVDPTFAERLAEQLTINASPAGRRARRRAKVRARLARIDWLALGALGSPIALAVHVGGRPVALYLAAAAALVCLLVGAVEVSAVVVGYLRGLLGFGPRAGGR